MRPRTGAVTLILAATLAATAAAEDPFASCRTALDSDPGRREAGLCVFEAARGTGAWAAASELLRGHLARAPDEPWLHYYLAGALWADRRPEVVDHYRRSAELFARSGDAEAEAKSWLNLASFLRLTDRHREASAALDSALAAAQKHGDPTFVAQVEIEQVRQMLQAGQDFAGAYWKLRRIETVAFPDGPPFLQSEVVVALGTVAYNLGRWDEVRAYRRRGIELAKVQNNRYLDVSMRHGLAAVDLADPLSGVDRQTLITTFRTLLTDARAAGHRLVEAESLHELGRLVGGEEGEHLLEECVDLTRRLDQDVQLSACLRGLATLVAEDDPARAEALLDEALARALSAGDPWPMVYGWPERLAVRWQTLPRQEALEDSLRALDLIEALRELQRSETGRLGVGSLWSEAYYWLSGRLLGSEPTADEVALAFSLAERARARALLEDLSAPTGPSKPDDGVHHRVVREIVDVNRRLLDPATLPEERRELLSDLDDLETEEEALRAQDGAHLTPDFVELADVQAALAPHEALITFQLSPWQNPYGESGGGSWLVVVTPDRARFYPTADRAEVAPLTDLFLGMIHRRDGSHLAASAALGKRLLGPALEELPAKVDSLVVVPDGPLHQIPFAVLSTDPDGPALMEHYRITNAPSASLWLAWRQHPRAPAAAGALVFADPLPAGGSAAVAAAPDGELTDRSWALAVGWRPGALPEARREGERIVRLLGHGSQVLVGDEASEVRVKGDLGDFVALHFAAHALVDGDRPGRSAVLLAPGKGNEDGLLQAREIVGLDLSERLVVLSACRGALGEVLRGEGSMSLARAFFQAGARAILAAPWPLRDDEARRLTEAIYRRLARGADLATALASAQRELAAEGFPAAAWAGLQLHGDGTWAPFSPRPRRWPWVLAGLGVGIPALLLGLGFLRRRTAG